MPGWGCSPGRIFPEHWQPFAGAVPEELRVRPLVDAYATLLADPDPAVRAHAAREWCAWEDAHVSIARSPAQPAFRGPRPTP